MVDNNKIYDNNWLWQLSQFQGNKMKYTGKEKPGKGGKGGKKGC